jgi:uncharacterized protein (TIGR02284 family)
MQVQPPRLCFNNAESNLFLVTSPQTQSERRAGQFAGWMFRTTAIDNSRPGTRRPGDEDLPPGNPRFPGLGPQRRAAGDFRDFSPSSAEKENRSHPPDARPHLCAEEQSSVANPSKDLLEAEAALRQLVDHLRDEQKALQGIAEDLKNQALKRTLLAESLKRAEFRGRLENMLHQGSVRDVQTNGTAAGSFVRAWTQLRASLGAGDDSLIAAAAEGERAMLDSYLEALEKHLPHPVREVLILQAGKILSTCEVLNFTRRRAA